MRRMLLLVAAVAVVVVGVVATLAAGESGHSSAGVANAWGAGVAVTGPPEVVFRWATERCDEFDIPDMPARAFRDADGRVQLLDTHIVATRFLGSDLNRVRHDCTVVMSSHQNPDPAAFDDKEFLAATFTPDGTTVYGLVHNEYTGHTHPGQCPSSWYFNCWWNTLTLAVSTDKGETYQHPAGRRLVASIPYPYVPDFGSSGVRNPSNIVRKADGYYYAFAQAWRQPRGQPTYYYANCLIRTRNLADPASWRAWNAGRFDMTFVDPYGPIPDPDEHLCRSIAPALRLVGELPIGSITFSTYAKQWLLVGNTSGGFFSATSPDLIHWSEGTIFYEGTIGWEGACGGPDAIQYASLLDPASTSRNFSTMGRTAYVYFTRFNNRSPVCRTTGLDRDLLRVPIRLVQAQVAALTTTVKGHLAVIRWRGNSDANMEYDIALRRLPGAWKTISLASRQYSVHGTTGQRYQVKVRAWNDDVGPGPWSPTRTFTLR